MSGRATRPPLGPHVIEKPAGLVPVSTGSPSGYAFHRPRPQRDTIKTTPPVPETSIDDDGDPYAEISVADDEDTLARAATIELPISAAIPAEPDAFFLSDEITRLRKQPPPDACWCSAFDEVVGKIFTSSDDGRFLILRPGLAEHEPMVRRLTAEQQVRGLMRLAIRVCPFDRYGMDSTLPVTAWTGSEEDPPLCCAWMAHAALVAGRVRFPEPDQPMPYTSFVDDEEQLLPFLYCPCCGTTMSALTAQRQTYFQRHHS